MKAYHTIPCHIISYHIILNRMKYNQIESRHIIRNRIISYHIISYHIKSYSIISHKIISYLLFSNKIKSNQFISYRISTNRINYVISIKVKSYEDDCRIASHHRNGKESHESHIQYNLLIHTRECRQFWYRSSNISHGVPFQLYTTYTCNHGHGTGALCNDYKEDNFEEQK